MTELSNHQRQRFAEALSRLSNDEETLVMLATMAAEDAPEMIEHLSTAITSTQLSVAAATGHSLKGLLSTFETSSPVSELQFLIDAARANDLPTTTSLFVALKPSLEALVTEVAEISSLV